MVLKVLIPSGFPNHEQKLILKILKDIRNFRWEQCQVSFLVFGNPTNFFLHICLIYQSVPVKKL